MKKFNILNQHKTKFFKRQADIFFYLKEKKIFKNNQKILIPSFMCSDVINSLISLKMQLIFYQLDQYLNFDKKEIEIILKNHKIHFFYFYKSFQINKSKKLSLDFLKSYDISLLVDNAHCININGNYSLFDSSWNSYNYLIETFSPRKYFKLREGGLCRINNEFIFTITETNLFSLFIDKLRRSIYIRRLIENSIIRFSYFFIKNNFLKYKFSNNKKLSFKKIGVSNIHNYYYKNYENKIHIKSKDFYLRYLDLFRDNINVQEIGIKIIKNNISFGDIFWLIPIKRDKRIDKLVSILEFSFLNSFMEWPDEHNFLSKADLEIRKKLIFFRVDCLSCNYLTYKYIEDIYNSKKIYMDL